MIRQLQQSSVSDIYGYDKQIEGIYGKIDRDLTPDTAKLIRRYDREMINTSKAKSTRRKHLQTLYVLSTMLKKQCFEALNKRVEDWHTSQSEGNVNLVKGRVNMFYLKLADTCQGSNKGLLGVPEDVCLMYTMKEMYAKLIPE